MIRLETTVIDEASPVIRKIIAGLGPAGRQEMNEAAAKKVSLLVRAHILDYAKTHHKTADNIRGGPAKRTDHLKHAGESVTHESSSTEGTVTISSPGFRRVLGPLMILPNRKQFLTIPVHAIAYGSTVGELKDEGKKIFRPKGRRYLAMRNEDEPGAPMRILYILARSANLKHEPDLLPTEEKMVDEAGEGVKSVIRNIIAKKGAA